MIKNYDSKGIEKLTILFVYGEIKITFKIKISDKGVEDIKTDNSFDTNLSPDNILAKKYYSKQ